MLGDAWEQVERRGKGSEKASMRKVLACNNVKGFLLGRLFSSLLFGFAFSGLIAWKVSFGSQRRSERGETRKQKVEARIQKEEKAWYEGHEER